jgi:ribosomal protein L14E/L6E/L27E
MMMDAGRICIVRAGSDAGKEVVVNEIIDRNFVMISGEKVKQRKINVKHLEPTSKKGAVIVPIRKEEPKAKKAPKKAEEKK